MHRLKKKILKIHFVVSLLCKLISLCYFSVNRSSITCVKIYLLTECSRIIGIVGLRENVKIFWIRLHTGYTETLFTVPEFRLVNLYTSAHQYRIVWFGSKNCRNMTFHGTGRIEHSLFFEHRIAISWTENFGVSRSPLQFWVQNFAFLSAKFRFSENRIPILLNAEFHFLSAEFPYFDHITLGNLK